MAGAAHRLEVATDLICDINAMKEESEGNTRDTSRGKKISPLQVKEMIHTFHLFDKNDDKSLDAKELASVFRALGQNPTHVELENIIRDADLNGNGALEEDEFVNLLVSRMQSVSDIKSDLEHAFDVFDRNGDNKIDKHELKQVLCMTGDTLSENEASEMMALMDDTGEGFVTKDQFIGFLCRDLPNNAEEDTDEDTDQHQTQKLKLTKR